MPKLAVVLLTAIILLGGAATPSLGGEGTDVPAGASAAPGQADLDGNRIFDDLEARLTSAGVDERISVIVLLDHAVTNGSAASAPPSAASARATASRLSVGSRLS